METRKLSKTVLKRLRKKGIIPLCPSDAVEKPSNESPSRVPENFLAKKKKKKKKKSAKNKANRESKVDQKEVAVPGVKSDEKPISTPTDKWHPDESPSSALDNAAAKKKKKKASKDKADHESKVDQTQAAVLEVKSNNNQLVTPTGKWQPDFKETPSSLPDDALAKKKKKKAAVKHKADRESEVDQTQASVLEVKSDDIPIVPPTGKRHRKHDSKDMVAYPNISFVSKDTDSVGGLIRAELVGLKKQSENIKSARDLSENQAHVIKRQITKIQGADLKREVKRPKHEEKTIGQAATELAQLLKKQKMIMATSKKSAKA